MCALLQELSIKGHDLQLHIHPQWWYSSFNLETNVWEIDLNHFKVSDCPRTDVEEMFESGVRFLNNICLMGGGKLTSYRAGGWSFLSESWFYEMLEKHGIIRDFSVKMLCVDNSPFQYYDYTKIVSPHTYHFSKNILEEDENGFFHEFPASGTKISSIRYLLTTLFINKQHFDLQKCGDGVGIKKTAVARGAKIRSLISRLYQPVVITSSIDGTSGYWLSIVYSKVLQSKSDVFVIIGHPKTQNGYGIKCLENFLRNHAEDVVTTQDF